MTQETRERALFCLDFQNNGAKYGNYPNIYVVGTHIYLERYVADSMKAFYGIKTDVEVIEWNDETRREAKQIRIERIERAEREAKRLARLARMNQYSPISL